VSAHAQDASNGPVRPAPQEVPQPPGQAPAAEPPESGNPQFRFYRVDNTFLRLDLRTGALASCRRQDAGWTCAMVPEERAALDGEIARLQRENALLKNALLERGLALPDGTAKAGPPPIAPAPQAESIPRPPQSVPPVAVAPSVPPPKSGETDQAARDDAELDRIMGIMEKVWRRLVEMMMTIQRDVQKKG
jgi:hypothetical protein